MMESLLQWCFPESCAICGQEDFISRWVGVCKSCRKEYFAKAFPNLDKDRCLLCKNPIHVSDQSCHYCDSRNVFIDGSLILRPKNQWERFLMNQLKFQNQRILSRFFALDLKTVLPVLRSWNVESIVPVPSHPSSKKNRPYLSFEVVMRRISKKCKIPILNLLEKKSIKQQSKMNRMERFLHAKSAFQIQKKYLQKLPVSLLLIDDVFTTGATTNEIACLLKYKGVKKVYQLVLVRPLEGIEI